jgi:hypothetical protein
MGARMQHVAEPFDWHVAKARHADVPKFSWMAQRRFVYRARMASQGLPRLSLEGFQIHVHTSAPRNGRSPRIALHLSKASYPVEDIDPFSPLRLPERVDITLRDVDASLIRRLRAELQAELVRGTHRFPLARHHHFEVEVAEGTMAYVRMEAGAPPEHPTLAHGLTSRLLGGTDGAPDAADKPVVRSVELTFSPPLVLTNVIPTLFEVRALFRDRALGAVVRDRFAGRTSRLSRSLHLDRLLETLNAAAATANRLGVVELRHVRAEPELNPHSGKWHLRLSFTGHVQLTGGVPPIPFADVVLPAIILPIPYATLDDLLSQAPLASADLRRDRVRVDEAVEGVRGMLAAVHGRFEVSAKLPTHELRFDLVDRTQVEVTAALPPDMTLSGRLEGTLQNDTLSLALEDVVVGFPEPSLRLSVRALVEDPGPSGGRFPDRLLVHLENKVARGSAIPRVDLEVATSHPLATGSSRLSLSLHNVRVDGGAGGLSIHGKSIELWPMSRQVEFRTDLSTSHNLVLEEVGLRREVRVPQGTCTGSVELGQDGLWHLSLGGSAGFAVRIIKKMPCIPELAIEGGDLVGEVAGKLEVRAAADADFAISNAFDVTLTEGVVAATLDGAEVGLEDRSIVFPSGTNITLRTRQAGVTSSGFGELAFDVGWDMHGEPTILRASGRTASLLATDLRQGELTVHFAPEGRLWFSGERQGLYGIRYFNTLLNPAADPEQLFEILRSDEALSHVFSALELVSPELADRATLLRDLVLGLRTIAQRAGIRELRHFIPRPSMARFMSLLLAGDESLADRIAVQIKRATESRGIDVIEVKNILRPFFDEFDVDYEVDGIVRWLERLMRPLAPIPDEPPVELLPLALDPAFADEVSGLPSAAEIYRRVQRREVDSEFTLRLCRLAVMLTAEQLDYILALRDGTWRTTHVQWLAYVRSVKKRVQSFAAAYGGIEYALQGSAIATVLGEAIADGSDPALVPDSAFEGGRWPPACALGPDEVATLLKAGLALGRQGRQTQINNRMLIDLIERRSSQFALEVLAEIGLDNPNALSGVLLALLDQEQDHMRVPVDLAALLERKLGLPVPRRRDFMAGGRRAPDSFYEAMTSLADAVMGRTLGYLARKSHLQVQRHAVPSRWRLRPRHRTLADAAREAIRKADRAAAGCTFGRKGARDRERVTALYRTAFARCSELLAQDRTAFQSPWLKAFWTRNEEALKALSVVRGYQQDVDEVRSWLHRRTGVDRFDDEQDLLRGVVHTLIYDPQDRKKLMADPLVRLLIDPDPDPVDFTIVSCMGVITEGEQGTELEDAFRRLTEQRGVRVIRAPTGTAMSLEENARRIIASIRQVEGPYGLLGYSQGCANALAAESLLRGGTPDQQTLLDRLVCRNLLFSAFNGSAHGTFAAQKFVEAMIHGERFLKHYQVRYSSEVVGAFLRIVRAVLDSPLFVRVLAGVHSLTPARAKDFHREMQIVEHAPTSTIRGVVEEPDLPETLELTWYALRHMKPGAEQDTQVLAADAIGASTRVLNDATRLLARCDMPSLRQAIHHWSPLLKETRFVTTERDRERRVYDSPKDRHVFPWVDVNARFGLIKRATDAGRSRQHR